MNDLIYVNCISDSLIENFHPMSGMEEWSFKVYCDRKLVTKKIDELSEETALLEKQILASSPGKAFLLSRKKTELIVKVIDRLCKKYRQQYYVEFKKFGESVIINNLLPREYIGREDTMILDATVFVKKINIVAFINAVNKLNEMNEDSGFYIETTCPRPPYDFVSIKRE